MRIRHARIRTGPSHHSQGIAGPVRHESQRGGRDDPTKRGLLIQKRTTTAHPVERVYGVLGGGANTDDLIEEIHGR